MKKLKQLIKWLFTWSTITSALLGASIGLHIKQYKRNSFQMEVNVRFHNESKTIKEVFDIQHQIDSLQSKRIIELKELYDSQQIKNNPSN